MSRENGGMNETHLDAVRRDVIETIMFGYADAAISDEFGAEWGAGGEQEAREVVLEQFSDAAADAPIARYRVTVNVEEI